MQKYLIAVFCSVFPLMSLLAGNVTTPANLPAYYSSLDGKSGSELWSAVHSVAKTGYSTSISYSTVWTVYQTTDVYPTGHERAGKIWDMYGECYFIYSTNQCGSYQKECDCYNREHSIPKSWFGGSESANTPGSDVFHLVPTDGKVNGMRSNYAFGEVNTATWSYNNSKLGTPKSVVISNSMLGTTYTATVSGKVFEPIDEYKGDFARGYFGTLLHWAGDYQAFTTDDGAKMFSGTYTAEGRWGLTPYGIALLLKWHRQDPVSQKEIDRNNGIQQTQGNRNPFIDYPDLAEYIWGSHAGEAFPQSSTTGTFDGSYDPTGSSISAFTVTLNRHGVTTTLSDLTSTYTLSLAQDEQDACEGWQFDGWVNSQVSTPTTTKPTYATSASTTSTFYAVYKNTVSGGGSSTVTVSDELTLSTTGVTAGSTDYSSWSGKTDNSDAVYAGQSAGDKSAIQLRSKNSNSGIITTASGGKAKKVTIVWNSNTTNGRTLNIYGKNSAYSAPTDLYNNSNQGTLLGTIVKGTSTELSITNDYAYIGMRSDSGAMFLDKVTVDWETEGSGGSTTTYTTAPNCPAVTYTVTWNVDGNTNNDEFNEGAELVLPEDPQDCSGSKTFVGWTADKNSPESFITSSDEVHVIGDVTYYAVYAEETAAGTSVVTYEKQTSGTASGQYLIVNEGSSKVFDGSLNTLDEVNNVLSVTIANNSIASSSALENAEFTISGSTIINKAGKYIGNSSNSNSLTGSNTELTNTISFDGSGNATIISSGGAYMRYNNASDQNRFRYFKSGTYTSQQPIQLYKRTETGGEAQTIYSTSCSQSITTAVEEAKSTLTVSDGRVISTGEIYIYNIMGQMVRTATKKFDLSELQEGIYLISNGKEAVRAMKN